MLGSQPTAGAYCEYQVFWWLQVLGISGNWEAQKFQSEFLELWPPHSNLIRNRNHNPISNPKPSMRRIFNSLAKFPLYIYIKRALGFEEDFCRNVCSEMVGCRWSDKLVILVDKWTTQFFIQGFFVSYSRTRFYTTTRIFLSNSNRSFSFIKPPSPNLLTL